MLEEVSAPVSSHVGEVAASSDAVAAENVELKAVGFAEVGQAAQIADALVSLIHTYQNLKFRVADSQDPEVASLFLLVRLVKGGPKRAKELAEAMCADQSTVSRQVAALVKSGLIERQSDPDDGRASILVPTDLGADRVEEHFVNRGHGVEPIIADWPAADRGQFLHLLRRYNSTLEVKRDEVISSMSRGHSLKHAALAAPPIEHSHRHHRIERSN